MKSYKISYFKSGDRTKPYLLSQIVKSGRLDGVRIYAIGDGEKKWQCKYKNNLLNGLDMTWRYLVPKSNCCKNNYFRNFKKGSEQGIQILFK